ncbi:MAG: hypothetical protein LBS85_01320 [Clostridiales Family XIII bacterium]|jgi:hypothetical protein|nr:hypothetical protein [Clostridiales Family XIII bacterium]
MRKNIKGKRRGSLAVEIAIMLPLFMVGILTVGYCIKFAMIEENVQHSLIDETHKLAADAAILPIPVTYKKDLAARLSEESRGEIENIVVEPLRYRVPGIGSGGRIYTDLIGVSVSYYAPLHIPRIFREGIAGEETVVCRAFVGALNDGPSKPFSEMERDEDSVTVWVFPRAGERYHGESCSYIQNNPREVLLDKQVRSHYSPCELCRPNEARDGALVYCFPTSGKVYHSGDCYIVERYVVSMDEEDAKKRGYSPCAKCGGH